MSRLPLHLRLCADCGHTQARHGNSAPYGCTATDRRRCSCPRFRLREDTR